MQLDLAKEETDALAALLDFPIRPSEATDDDGEDGDIATPKRDRYGDDDQPL